METFTDAIQSATNLDELCEALNALEAHISELNTDSADANFYRASDYIDHCELKLFSKNEPRDVCEIFSYDNTRCLIQNTCLGDAWEIVERTEEFGS